MVVVPGLTHLAILSLRLLDEKYKVVVIDNGLSDQERGELSKLIPGIFLFRLKTNRFRGRQMMDTHPEVIETLAYIPRLKIIFIDADCYIFDKKIISAIIKQLDDFLFSSPFWFQNNELGEIVPETFLLGINTVKLREIKKIHGIKFGDSCLNDKLKQKVFNKWKLENPWPQPYKKIFDTIHIPLLAGLIENMRVGCVNSVKGTLFHVCATSYNHHSFQTKENFDLLIINAHYFHLKIIELLQFKWLEGYFRELINFYGSSQKLKETFKEYSHSHQCSEVEDLVVKLSKSQQFRTKI
jgi:hypothetical protein